MTRRTSVDGPADLRSDWPPRGGRGPRHRPAQRRLRAVPRPPLRDEMTTRGPQGSPAARHGPDQTDAPPEVSKPLVAQAARGFDPSPSAVVLRDLLIEGHSRGDEHQRRPALRGDGATAHT